MRKFLFVFLVFFVSFPLFALKVGDPSPFFSVRDLDGNRWKLARLLRGNKGILLVFFSMHCPHCREELPFLKGISKKYRDRGLFVLGICVDRERERVLKSFRNKANLEFPVAMDKGIMSRIYNIYGVPSNFLIDSEGNIKTIEIGFSKEAASELERAVEKLLKKR